MDFKTFKSKYQQQDVLRIENTRTKPPMLSVCIQTYQHAGFIRQCLDGVLMQNTDFDFEILLGDDASNDGTREICLEYAKKFPDKIRLFLHHRENNIFIEGKATGRFNFLYNLFSARGVYLAICEGDDFWTDKNKLQKQVDFLKQNSEYTLCAHYCNVLGASLISPAVLPIPDMDFSSLLRRGLQLETLSVVFRNNFNGELPDWIASCPNGDYPLYLILLESGGKVKYLEEVMGCYRKHEGGMWSSNSLASMGEKGIRSMQICNEGFGYRYAHLFKKAIRYRRRKFGLLEYNLFALFKGETAPGDFVFKMKKWLKAIVGA